MFDEIKKIKSGKKELREFGFVIGGALFIFGSIALWRGKSFWPHLYGAGTTFALFGAVLPNALMPLQKAWMAFSIVVGFFMSRVVLGILFYFVITPIGFIMKMSGKDILDERIDRSGSSYWKPRDDADKIKESYEKQF